MLKKELRERDIERQLLKRVKEEGGDTPKVKWIGRNGAPDRVVMLPPKFGRGYPPDLTVWVELKAPGKKPEPHQVREHERMRKRGQRVEVVDSFERIEEILRVKTTKLSALTVYADGRPVGEKILPADIVERARSVQRDMEALGLTRIDGLVLEASLRHKTTP